MTLKSGYCEDEMNVNRPKNNFFSLQVEPSDLRVVMNINMMERGGPDVRDSGDRQIADSHEKGDKHTIVIYQLSWCQISEELSLH